jgi:hypothetical protein
MKKIGKLTISPEKIMKNEELINLQGGYGTTFCCFCNGFMGMAARDQFECIDLCLDAGYMTGRWVCDRIY